MLSTELETIELVMIFSHASSALISAEFLAEIDVCWGELGLMQCIESHGSDPVLEGILVSHSL